MPTILVADDDESLRAVIAKALAGPGRVVLLARDGTEALSLCAARSPDVLVLDARMPGLDGFEVCRSLRDRANGCPRILMLSGALDTPPRDPACLPDLFLAKPFRLNDLAAAVSGLLEHPVG